MARFPEQRLWDRIRKNVGRAVHIERLENSAGFGTPDSVVIYNASGKPLRGSVTFAEHKTADEPVRETTRLQFRHPLTPPQRNWHRMWAQNGGRSLIVVGVGLRLFAVPGKLVDEVNGMTLKDISPWAVDYAQLELIYKGRWIK